MLTNGEVHTNDGVAIVLRGDTLSVVYQAPARLHRSRWIYDAADQLAAKNPEGILCILVVLPTATEAQAVVVMERLRSAVASADWTDLIPCPVTVSIGVATAPAVDEEQSATVVGWRALFDTADLHLFSAKRGGRNRVRAPGAGSRPDPEGDETADDDVPEGAGE